ncbi:MAG TPA: M1 family metallopeptidase, partial [Polyangia bacterium]
AALHPAWEPWLEFARSREQALATDALAATHPIRMPVGSPDQAREAFDGITYSKGASVLRMLERWLGEETWRRGVGDYLRAHAEGNATGDDLWRALGAVSHEPVSEVARAWIERAGHPLVAATARCNAGKTELVLAQSRDGSSASERPWPIPLCARTASASACALMRAATETRVVAPTCEPWALANAESGGFYRVRYDASTLMALGRAAEKSLQPIERAGLVGDEWALVRDGRAPLTAYLELVAGFGSEPNDNVVAEVRRRLMRVGHELVTARDTDRWRGFVDDLFGGALAALGWQARAGESVERRQLRAVLWETLGDAEVPAALQAAARALPRYLADPTSVDATLAGTVVDLAARSGDAAEWQTYRSRMLTATTPDERDRFLRALTFFSTPQLVDQTLALSLSKEVRSQDAGRLLTTALGHPWARRAAWTFVKTRWGELAAKVPANLLGRVVGSVGGFCDRQMLGEALAFFADKQLPGIKRRLAQAKEDGEQCIAWKAREATPLSDWLRARGRKHAMR